MLGFHRWCQLLILFLVEVVIGIGDGDLAAWGRWLCFWKDTCKTETTTTVELALTFKSVRILSERELRLKRDKFSASKMGELTLVEGGAVIYTCLPGWVFMQWMTALQKACLIFNAATIEHSTIWLVFIINRIPQWLTEIWLVSKSLYGHVLLSECWIKAELVSSIGATCPRWRTHVGILT